MLMEQMGFLLSFSKTVLLFVNLAKSNFQLCFPPSCWKFANIQPIPAEADCSDPLDYHPIALILCLSKIFFILSSTGSFIIIYQFISFCLIISMSSIKVTLLFFFWLSSTEFCHPSLGIFVKLLLLSWIYQKLLIESGSLE